MKPPLSLPRPTAGLGETATYRYRTVLERQTRAILRPSNEVARVEVQS